MKIATPNTGAGTCEASAAALAATDADAFRQEGPRIDNRVNTLLTLVLGGLASSGGLGGVGAAVSHRQHAYLAMWLLVAAAVVILTGLVLIVELILPRLTRQVTVRSGHLARVAALPDQAAAHAYYQAAAQDCLAHQALAAWSHATAIRRRFRRFRRAGYVLLAGVLLATAGFLALGWGW